ncbi:FG-GAP-like repeat-containing protein, partial [Hymenobacter sp. UV11]
VDGDGALDLLTANYNGNSVSVRLNDGSGSFGGGSNPAVGSNPYSVAVGDVDGDGDLDLLAANNTGSSVSVRLNQN